LLKATGGHNLFSVSNLAQQRCLNHAEREAAARCLGCGHFFCRECVTEHDDRVICALCLRRLARGPGGRRRGLSWVAPAGRCLAGLAAAWLFFYLLGEALASLPASYHEGTLWRAKWLDEE
jgi:hypothetical protein